MQKCIVFIPDCKVLTSRCRSLMGTRLGLSSGWFKLFYTRLRMFFLSLHLAVLTHSLSTINKIGRSQNKSLVSLIKWHMSSSHVSTILLSIYTKRESPFVAYLLSLVLGVYAPLLHCIHFVLQEIGNVSFPLW